jgi:hypothetical protein
MWFQPDLPNPAVDLGKLGRDEIKDKVPEEYKKLLEEIDGQIAFRKRWVTRYTHNFYDESLMENRFFKEIFYQD